MLALPALPRPGLASGGFARVSAVSGGGGTAHLPDGTSTALAAGLLLPDGTRIETLSDGLAELALEDGTRIHSGRDTRITLQGTGAQSAAALTMTGVMVVDRRELPQTRTMTVSGTAFDVELAGAQVFIESLGTEAGGAVFVKAGGAAVLAGEEEILLASGEGVDFAAMPAILDGTPDRGTAVVPAEEVMPGAEDESPPDQGALPAPVPPPPMRPPVQRWSEDRVADAFASVGLTT